MAAEEMNEERAATLKLIDRKIAGLVKLEKRQREDAPFARQCFEALRDEIENGLHLP